MIAKDDIKLATYIPLTAVAGKAAELGSFLRDGAPLVKNNEPNTKLWFALKDQNSDDIFGIFDVFPTESARGDHFRGLVASALQERAATLIQGGWNHGVLNQVNNFEILSSRLTDGAQKASLATYIRLDANPGQEQQLANLLTGAASLIEQTEPNTLFWIALKLNQHTFGIFDTFTDASARDAHFTGQVAGALKDQSADLIRGGWDNGVLRNVHNFEIIASI